MAKRQLEILINNLKKRLDDSVSGRILLEQLKATLSHNKTLGNSRFTFENELSYAISYESSKDEQETPLAFIFGAGISCPPPFGLPSWDELVQNAILGRFFEDSPIHKSVSFDTFKQMLTCETDQNDYSIRILEKNILDSKCKNNSNEKKKKRELKKIIYDAKDKIKKSTNFFYGADLYELAQYIELNLKNKQGNDLKTDKEIEQRTDRKLYSIVKNSLYYRRTKDINEEEFENSYLYCLSRIIKTNRVRRIITYNYDDCLEYSYNFKNDKGKAITIYSDSMLRSVSETDNNCVVYHVHGFIPYYTQAEIVLAEDEDDEKIKLILSEESYDKIAQSSYKWRNTVQVDTLLRYRCIFMGFSATDKNFKRIVNILYRHEEKPKVNHKIFLTIDDYLKGIFNENIYSDVNYECKDDIRELDSKCRFLLHILKDKDDYLTQAGLKPIWTTVCDINNIVKECYKEYNDGIKFNNSMVDDMQEEIAVTTDESSKYAGK